MKADIEQRDWYPVFCVYFPNGDGKYDIPDYLLKRYKKVRKEFDKVQDLLEKIYIEAIEQNER